MQTAETQEIALSERSFSSRRALDKAREQKRSLESFWFRLGYDVKARIIERITVCGAVEIRDYDVRADLVNGLPRGYRHKDAQARARALRARGGLERGRMTKGRLV